jgi:hypothetical protein
MESATATPDSRRYAGWEGGVSTPSPAAVESPYDHRVKLVSEVLTRNSLTSAAEARRLAIDVLQAIDHIPEKVR